MKMKNKLFKSLISISTIAPMVAMVVSLSSCGSDKQTKTPQLTKINFNATPKEASVEALDQPFMIENKSDKEIRVNTFYKYGEGENCYYLFARQSQSDDTWGEPWGLTGNENGDEQTIEPGQKMQFFGYNTKEGVSTISTSDFNLRFEIKSYDYSGNPVPVFVGASLKSLVMEKDPFKFDEKGKRILDPDVKAYTIMHDNMYKGLFAGSESLYGVSANFLNEIKYTTPHCFDSMFKNCPMLKCAPMLPAVQWANGGEETPTLKDGVAEGAYQSMFEGCTSLETAPYLPATKLNANSYASLFSGCSKLNSINLAYYGNFNSQVFGNWVKNVPSTGLIFYDGADDARSVNELPTGWTVKQNQQVQSDLRTISLQADQESSKIVGKSKVAVLKNDSAENLLGDNSPIKYSPLSSADDFEGMYNTDGQKVDLTGKTFNQLPDTLIPKFGWDTSKLYQANCVNAMFYKAGKLTNPHYGSQSATVEYQLVNNENPTPSETGWSSIGNNTITVPARTNVLLRSKSTYTGFSKDYDNYQSIKLTLDSSTDYGKGIKLCGNIKSLILKADGTQPTAIPNDRCFSRAFEYSDITYISKDFLPFTTLTKACYTRMFWYCTKLTCSPDLPATEIPEYIDLFKTGFTTTVGGSYARMFEGCSSLTSVGKISANTFHGKTGLSGVYCCAMSRMFEGCSSLQAYKSEEEGTELVFTATSNVYQDAFNNMFTSTKQDGNKTISGSLSANQKVYIKPNNYKESA